VSTDERLRALVRVACEDALFAIAGSGPAALDAIAERRRPAHEQVAREGKAIAISDLDAWLTTMVRTAAPEFVPWMVPMRDAIEDGMTLLREPRGLRALIPIGAEEKRARLRREAIFAVRIARAIAAADGAFSPDEERSLELLLAALGLSDDDTRMLSIEAPIPIAAIELPTDLDPRVARAMVSGAFRVASADRLDDCERDAISEIAGQIGVDAESVSALGTEAARELEQQRRFGHALLDVVRYVLLPIAEEETRPLMVAAIHLALPATDRAAALRITTTPLVELHELDRGARERALAAAWACALAIDPRLSVRAHLRARYARAALHLEAGRMADEAQAKIENWLDAVLARGASVVGV